MRDIRLLRVDNGPLVHGGYAEVLDALDRAGDLLPSTPRLCGAVAAVGKDGKVATVKLDEPEPGAQPGMNLAIHAGGRYQGEFVIATVEGGYVLGRMVRLVEGVRIAVREDIGDARRLYFGTFPSEVRPEHVTPAASRLITRYASNRTLIGGGQSGSDGVRAATARGDDVLFRASRPVLTQSSCTSRLARASTTLRTARQLGFDPSAMAASSRALSSERGRPASVARDTAKPKAAR